MPDLERAHFIYTAACRGWKPVKFDLARIRRPFDTFTANKKINFGD